MNRRSFLLKVAASCAFIADSSAWGARLPRSTVTVIILSVDEQSSTREIHSYGGVLEISRFVAKAQIQNVIKNEHDLTPGEVIEISYVVRAVLQPSGTHNGQFLHAGETITLSVFGGGRTFTTGSPPLEDAIAMTCGAWAIPTNG